MRTDPGLARLARGTILAPFAGTAPPAWLLAELEHGLGGVILFAINGNVAGTDQVAALTARLREVAEPIISIDEEGGDVTRLAHRTGSRYPGNAALGAVDDTALTRRVYRSLGAELTTVGVNLNAAPSVDVNSADDNPVIGTRAFGADPEMVSRHAAAAVAGLQEAGVAACAKHFPGHGATRQDSHDELPLVEADLEVVERRELAPFRAAIAAGTQTIMTGHVRIPAITGTLPATMSRAALTGLLRDRMGFRGPVVSDALDMRGASAAIGIPEAAVRALLAGVDLLCLGAGEFAGSVRAVTEAIVAAVTAGRLPAERLAEAAARAERLRGWLSGRPAGVPDERIGMEAARRAVRVHGDLRPMSGPPFVVELDAPPGIAVGQVPWGLERWMDGLGDGVVRVRAEEAGSAGLLERATGRPLVIVVRDAHRYPRHRELVSALVSVRPDAIVIEMGLPVWRPPAAAAYIATYGAAWANGRAAAELLGLTPAGGSADAVT
jgi:beta-glucosidase-like glycosyl hydrolase